MVSAALVPALVAAGVSLVVTLGIEYFAKPALEARKERILDRHRQRRAMEANLSALGFRAGQLLAMLEDPDARIEHAGDEVHTGIREHVNALIRSLEDGSGALDHNETVGLSTLTAGWATYLYLVDQGEPPEGLLRFYRQLEPVDDAVNDAFRIPRRRPVARKRAVRRMRELIREPAAETDSSSSGPHHTPK